VVVCWWIWLVPPAARSIWGSHPAVAARVLTADAADAAAPSTRCRSGPPRRCAWIRAVAAGAAASVVARATSAVVTNRGWDTNDFLPCGKVRPTCGASAGRQNPHTLTWFCGGSCGLQFVSRPTAYQLMQSPHEQRARQCKTANQRFVSKLMMANESSKLSSDVAPLSPLGQHGGRAPSS